MRRALLIFMMGLLPFQWVWAAAASTYTHESEVSTPQFSRHAHEHVHEHGVEQVSGSADGNQGSFAADHPHCGGLHVWADMGCDDATLPPISGRARVRFGTTTPAYNSHVPAGPERPDRSATP